jgi:hypothetical protein
VRRRGGRSFERREDVGGGPDGLAANDRGGGGDGEADEGVERPRGGEAESAADGWGAWGFRGAGEVGEVERDGGPEPIMPISEGKKKAWNCPALG